MLGLKNRAAVTFYLLTLIASMFILVPMSLSSPVTYGPRLDTLYGRFIESTSAQKAALYAGEADIWFDVKDPVILRNLQDDGFAVTATPEAFRYDHIDFNIRDQQNPSGGGSPWRTGPEEPPVEIDEVVLEGYTDGPYDEDVDYDVYATGFNWLGSLYGSGTPEWVTPRWVGTDTASDLYPALLTATGINDLEVMVHFWDPSGHGGPGNVLDCMRLKVEFTNGTVEYLYVDGYTAERQQWTEVGTSPFLDAADDGNYIEGSADCSQHRWFTFEDIGFEDPPGLGDHFSYSGAQYTNYVPLNDTYFRHAVAHCIPKDEIVAYVYGGISGAAIDSLIPEAQRAWYTPGIDGHPLAMGDPLASTVWDGADLYHDACSILRAGGYTFDPEGPEPVVKYSPYDPDGNWVDPITGEWMNHITFAGVTQEFSPVSWSRDDMCCRNWRSIGLPIEHRGVDYGHLTDVMIKHYQYDMYALEWEVGRFPNHLYSFFHSSNNFAPGGRNIPGVDNSELDGYLDTIQHSGDLNEIKEATIDASALLAELCVSLPTFTRPLFAASAVAGAPGHTDTLQGIVNCPGYGSGNDWTFYDLHWRSVVTESNPCGIGGPDARMIVGSEPSNYHPAFASTPDEWRVLDRVFEGLINLDPYSHEDIPWLATDWWIEDWDYGGSEMGMNTTFWLRDDVYYHDGVHFDAYTCEFSLEWLKDMQLARLRTMWQNLFDVEVHSDYCFSVYHNTTSLWTFYDIAKWAPLIPPHIYDGTDMNFRPEMTTNPLNGYLTCLVGTGPYMITDLMFSLGGYVELTAYRENVDLDITTHWFMSVEEEDALLTQMFHWKGDVNYDGFVDDLDLLRIEAAYGTVKGQPGFDPDADLDSDDRINAVDMIILSKGWGKARKYPLLPDDLMLRMTETIESWNLNQGTENSLTSTVDAALDLLNMGNENGAIHKLMDFINQVEAKRGKKLTDTQADHLIAEAQRIIDLI
ncbi:MAG: hypothetical protein JSV85_01710 [Candidatus Bathyarchaeota archaeon]|nr:MAG: hypothetical protein JSV85_01710 [Candidatus Bathyarchaeota archaeon]